jgi:hypothetical protein
MRLLQGSWSEILTLSLCYRSQPAKNNGTLNFASDFNISEQEAKDSGLDDFFNHVSNMKTFQTEIVTRLLGARLK